MSNTSDNDNATVEKVAELRQLLQKTLNIVVVDFIDRYADTFENSAMLPTLVMGTLASTLGTVLGQLPEPDRIASQKFIDAEIERGVNLSKALIDTLLGEVSKSEAPREELKKGEIDLATVEIKGRA